MKKIARRGCLAAGTALLAAVTAGCGLTGLGSAGRPQTGPRVTVTEDIEPSVLVTVAGGTVAGPALARLIAATARPREDLEILQADAPPGTLIAADSPGPAKVIVPGKPAAPGPGATPYLWAEYRKLLRNWHGEIIAAKQGVYASTEAAMYRWARRLRIMARLAALPGTGGDPSRLAGECAIAAGALVVLQQEVGNPFGTRRVLLLYAARLGGALPAAELAGDDVIVVTSFLPTAAAASAAQANLLRAGATRATVLGPATAAQIARLVTAGLSQQVITETLSGPALFANNSAVLQPGAASLLAPLLPLLRRPEATGVINGYASTPGTPRRNYKLSHARAAAVARFLEGYGIPASSLAVVGHGATNLIAPGPSAANRRVTIVIEAPSSNRP